MIKKLKVEIDYGVQISKPKGNVNCREVPDGP